MRWNDFQYGQTITDDEKWYFYKSNYIKGDADCDGALSVLDRTYVQRGLAHIINLNNIEKYLSDVNYSGNTDIIDACIIGQMLSNNLIY